MKPVLNSISREIAVPGSIWLPVAGGGCFSTDMGLVIVDEIVRAEIHYHYERCNLTHFSQIATYFYQFARRVS